MVSLHIYKAIVIDIYDADTVTVDIDLGFNLWLRSEKVRLSRINAYEIRLNKKKGITPEIKQKGLEGRDYLKTLIEGKEVLLQTTIGKNRGKYGRILGEIVMDGINLNDDLVSKGYAVYHEY